MKNFTKLAAATAVAALTSTGAMAATNPAAAGLTSVGDFIVSITKGDVVRISQLADIIFPPASSTLVDLSQSNNVCVYSTTGKYNITATSTNAFGTQLRLVAGANTMNYSVDFSGTALPHGINVTGFTGASMTDELCSGGTNATITATILAADFNAAPSGAYADLLTLTFAPE